MRSVSSLAFERHRETFGERGEDGSVDRVDIAVWPIGVDDCHRAAGDCDRRGHVRATVQGDS